MKVLVTGASGMLGIQVCRIASQELGKGNVIAMTHEDLDITSEVGVASVLESAKPDVIVNCAGIVRSRNLNPGQFISVNCCGPHILETEANKRDMRLVQVSTDCVFDGSGPKTEKDSVHPIDIYGESKALGEVTLAPHLTVRLSFIGVGARGLLSWFLKQTGNVQGYTGAQWNGLTTIWAARKIIKAAKSANTGLLHLFGEDLSKFQVLSMAAEVMDLPVSVVPSNTVHSDMRLRTVYGFNDQYPAPPLKEQLVELARLIR